MEFIRQAVPLMLALSLALLILSVALGSSRGQFAYVLLRPALLLRAIAAVNIIPLIAAMLVVAALPQLSVASKMAILFMALSPVPPLVPGKALKAGGREDYVYGLQMAMGCVAIVIVPLLGTMTAHHYDASTAFPPSIVLRNVLFGLALPILVGILLGRWLAPAWSLRIAPLVQKAAILLLGLAALPILIGFWSKMMALVGDGTVLAIACVVLIAVLGGHLLGGEEPRDRPALAFAAGTRHPGIALALLGANHADPDIAAAVLLFLLVGLIVTIPYQMIMRRTLNGDKIR